jgi:hypothetical protein
MHSIFFPPIEWHLRGEYPNLSAALQAAGVGDLLKTA